MRLDVGLCPSILQSKMNTSTVFALITIKLNPQYSRKQFVRGVNETLTWPLKDSSIVEKRLEDILVTSKTSEWFYLIEVNLTIPEELHDFFAHCLLAPSREVVCIGATSKSKCWGKWDSPKCQRCQGFCRPCTLKRVICCITLP